MTNFKPHLATDADLSKVKYPVIVMPKIDGCRMLVNGGKATGRSLKAYKNKKLTEYFSQPVFDGMDGELAAGQLRDEDLCRNTTSLVNTIEGTLPDYYMVFDYLHESVIDEPYMTRLQALESHVEANWKAVKDESGVWLSVPEWNLCNTPEEVLALYEQYLAEGFEGVVLRDPQGKHKNGRCTAKEAAYLRIKPSGDAEGIVVELIEAMENQNEAKMNELGYTERSSHKENKVGKGMIGAMIINLVDSEGKLTGKQEKIGAGKMTHGQREYYWNHPDEILGKIVKWRSMSVGIKDKARHGRWIGFRAEEDMSC